MVNISMQQWTLEEKCTFAYIWQITWKTDQNIHCECISSSISSSCEKYVVVKRNCGNMKI